VSDMPPVPTTVHVTVPPATYAEEMDELRRLRIFVATIGGTVRERDCHQQWVEYGALLNDDDRPDDCYTCDDRRVCDALGVLETQKGKQGAAMTLPPIPTVHVTTPSVCCETCKEWGRAQQARKDTRPPFGYCAWLSQERYAGPGVVATPPTFRCVEWAAR
jgi:hypothetical protein